jgi:hypothetical protein
MPYYYSTYGLKLQSEIKIPGLLPISGLSKPDVNISLGSIPVDIADSLKDSSELIYRTPSSEADEKLAVHRKGNYYRLNYHDDTTFIINQQGTQIWANWPDSLTLEDTATYLLGPVLGFVLLRRGIHSLHASAIVVEGQAIALVGPSCAGKSTTAAAFAGMGYPVLTDDVLCLDVGPSGQFLVHPAYPRIRLWDDSAGYLFGQDRELPLLTPNWDKRFLDLSENQALFQQEPVPLAAIYLLAERENNPEAPCIKDVSPPDGLVSLIGNSYVNYLLDHVMRREEFVLLGRIARTIPVRKVTPHASPAYIRALCDIILRDALDIWSAPNQSVVV